MRVHHLDCCTMRPRVAPWAKLVSHCLLLETDAHGLVLVDAGIGMDDVKNPRRLGAIFAPAMRIDRTMTKMPAVAQIEELGFRRADVRHVVLTHADFDHAGGAADFPSATVHVHATEKDAAIARATFMQRTRYRPAHLTHASTWKTYDSRGEPWRGTTARTLEGLPPEILAIPMSGHSRGHASIAVDTAHGWLVHAGDAYFHRSVIERGDASGTPWPLRLVERFIAVDYAKVKDNHAALADLAKHEDVTVFCAHDPVEFQRSIGR
jgi:glyoxylase-like metal-dependent hydrolase (beta-lactamase superfamily II)